MQRSGIQRIVHGVAHRALRIPPIGIPFCAATSAMGLNAISRRASRHAKYVPASVSFNVMGSDGQFRHGSLSSCGGRDQIARSIWLHGLESYETPLPQLFMHLVKGAQTVLDIGANSGLYAILAALVEPGCQVISFEPFPPALASLNANLTANQLNGRVKVENAAVGSALGERELFIPEKQFGDVLETSASLIVSFRPKHSEIIKVKVEMLDEYVPRNQIEHVSVIRADVEGAEHLVLEGAPAILQTHRPFVFVEILADISATYIERCRLNAGYRTVCLDSNALTQQATVKCVPKSPNHLLYPPESHEKVLAAAAALGLAVLADLADG